MTAFEELCQLEGFTPRLDVDAFVTPGVRDWVEGRCDAVIRARGGKVEIGCFDEPGINAFAAAHDGYDLIGVTTSLTQTTANIFRSLVTQPSFLREIGTVHDGTAPATFDGRVEDVSFGATIVEQPIQDAGRERLAALLGDVAQIFVFEHELAHLMHAHVAYEDQAYGVRAIVELKRGADRGVSGILSQTLEWDADMSAAQGVLLYVLRPVIAQRDGVDIWMLSAETPFGNQATAIKTAFAAIAVCMLLFSAGDPTDPLSKTASHPNPLHRLGFISTQFCHLLSYRTGGRFEDWIEMMTETEISVIEGWRSLFPNDRFDARIMLDRVATSHDKLQAYEACWAEIHPALSKLVRPGVRLAPAVPQDHPAFPAGSQFRSRAEE